MEQAPETLAKLDCQSVKDAADVVCANLPGMNSIPGPVVTNQEQSVKSGFKEMQGVNNEAGDMIDIKPGSRKPTGISELSEDRHENSIL